MEHDNMKKKIYGVIVEKIGGLSTDSKRNILKLFDVVISNAPDRWEKILSRWLIRIIKKKWGYDVGLYINEFDVKYTDDVKMKIHINIDAKISAEDLECILGSAI